MAINTLVLFFEIKKFKSEFKSDTKTFDNLSFLIGLSLFLGSLAGATAVENIDPIIKIIKSSKDTETAKKNLLSKKWSIKKSSKLISLIEKKQKVYKYQLSKLQIDSILELRLQKLTALG